MVFGYGTHQGGSSSPLRRLVVTASPVIFAQAKLWWSVPAPAEGFFISKTDHIIAIMDNVLEFPLQGVVGSVIEIFCGPK
ncbi:MAG: hypothetical protein F4Y80_00805 [Caldilineaceae bacterium SB0665_bin_21]|nr:hypothetical protein [Caldilineaceae bacterium SB0665_bin_21]MYA04867.1 hypothetical protein [Caldilineaceae bacterium SB0664_bin_22]MYC63369.1 hypothetical protein [Caldilineaceae bacterium SB0661_bin_34]